MLRKYSRPLSASIAVLALALAGCASAGGPSDATGEEVQTIRIGYHADWNGASLVAIADEQGLWEEHGLKSQSTVFTSGPIEVQALKTDDLDFAYVGQGALWLPATGEAKIATINTLSAASRVIAQPGISSMADLKGKKVGVPEGTSGDLVFTLALEEAGMTESDVELIPMEAATIVAAFSSGQIDGAASWYPLIDTIKATVPDLVEVASEADLVPGGGSPTAYLTSNRIASEDPELVVKFDAVMREAMDFRAAQAEEAVDITARFLKTDSAKITADASHITTFSSQELDEAAQAGEVSGWLTNLNAFFLSTGSMTSDVDPADYYLSDLWAESGK